MISSKCRSGKHFFFSFVGIRHSFQAKSLILQSPFHWSSFQIPLCWIRQSKVVALDCSFSLQIPPFYFGQMANFGLLPDSLLAHSLHVTMLCSYCRNYNCWYFSQSSFEARFSQVPVDSLFLDKSYKTWRFLCFIFLSGIFKGQSK